MLLYVESKNPMEQYLFSCLQMTVNTLYMCTRICDSYFHGNKCECTTISNLTVTNYVTFGAMPSLAESEGILGTEGFKSSASLSALMKKLAKDRAETLTEMYFKFLILDINIFHWYIYWCIFLVHMIQEILLYYQSPSLCPR